MYTRTGKSTCMIEAKSVGGEAICTWRSTTTHLSASIYYTVVFDTQLRLVCWYRWSNEYIWSSCMRDMREATYVSVIPYLHGLKADLQWDGKEWASASCVQVCVPAVRTCDIEFAVCDRMIYTRPPHEHILALPKFRQHKLSLKVALISEQLTIRDVLAHILELMYLVVMSSPTNYCIEVVNPFFM